jgi:hypothetical protein
LEDDCFLIDGGWGGVTKTGQGQTVQENNFTPEISQNISVFLHKLVADFEGRKIDTDGWLSLTKIIASQVLSCTKIELKTVL